MNLFSLLAEAPIHSPVLPLLAQEQQGSSFVFSWFLVGLTLVLGVMLAVRPVKREPEIKRERSMK